MSDKDFSLCPASNGVAEIWYVAIFDGFGTFFSVWVGVNDRIIVSDRIRVSGRVRVRFSDWVLARITVAVVMAAASTVAVVAATAVVVAASRVVMIVSWASRLDLQAQLCESDLSRVCI